MKNPTGGKLLVQGVLIKANDMHKSANNALTLEKNNK